MLRVQKLLWRKILRNRRRFLTSVQKNIADLSEGQSVFSRGLNQIQEMCEKHDNSICIND